MRASHCTNIPKKKAMATDTKMAMITESALSVLIRSPNARVASLFTLIEGEGEGSSEQLEDQ